MTRQLHQLTLSRKVFLSPGMVRLTFAVDEFNSFQATGTGDEYLRLFFPDPRTGRTVLPAIDAEGSWTWPEGEDRPHSEPYTVRRFDPKSGDMTIDFVVHEGGIASDWAQNAEPGQTIAATAPIGLYELPTDARWQILICDATGLPAAARLLEQTPQTVQSRVIIEVAEKTHEIELALPPNDMVTWLHGSGNGIGPSRLDEVLRRLPLPATPGYIWAAGEQKSMRAIRKHLRHDLKLAAERYKVVSYWIDKLEEWQTGWDALDPAIRDQIDAAWASERDREIVQDEIEATLERHGL